MLAVATQRWPVKVDESGRLGAAKVWGDVAFWKVKTVEVSLYHRGSDVVTDGKNSGKHLDLAIYAKDGCVYQASHIDEPPMTIVNGRRPRKLVWKQIHADLTHIPSSGYAEVAKTIDHLNELHGQCWTNVYKGHEGELSREFLDQIHQRASKRLPEDPDIHPGIPT